MPNVPVGGGVHRGSGRLREINTVVQMTLAGYWVVAYPKETTDPVLFAAQYAQGWDGRYAPPPVGCARPMVRRMFFTISQINQWGRGVGRFFGRLQKITDWFCKSVWFVKVADS